MTFREYIKDKLSIVILIFLIINLTILVVYLEMQNIYNELSLGNIIYIYILSYFCLLVYFIYDYRKKKSFLNILIENLKISELENYIFDLPKNISREYEIIRKAYEENYHKYMKSLDNYINKSEIQKNFNNRWIHEMKTPISVLKLMVDKKLKSGADRDFYKSMDEEINKLSSGLEMALYTLRVNSFSMDFRVSRVELVSLIRQVINKERSMFINNKVFPNLEFEEEVFVYSDKKWLGFVLKQILTNSIKYTSIKKDSDKKIFINIEKEERQVKLVVKDTGIGISKSDINRIFDPFFTGKIGRKYLESTGIGLYLVKIILDELGHGIKVESLEDIGTKMTIIFYENKNIYLT